MTCLLRTQTTTMTTHRSGPVEMRKSVLIGITFARHDLSYRS
jgi:hypothetical protein